MMKVDYLNLDLDLACFLVPLRGGNVRLGTIDAVGLNPIRLNSG